MPRIISSMHKISYSCMISQRLSGNTAIRLKPLLVYMHADNEDMLSEFKYFPQTRLIAFTDKNTNVLYKEKTNVDVTQDEQSVSYYNYIMFGA